MDRTSTVVDQEKCKTSIFEKFSYAMGDVACNIVFGLTSGLIVYFYTNVMSISAGLIGMIMLISRIFDGASDICISFIMDKVNSKLGKARAWILWMAFPYAICAVALFCVPANASVIVQAIYVFVTYNLCTTVVYTALNLPYASLAPLMTRDENDLAKINLFRMSLNPIGLLIVNACSMPIINRLGGGQRAWITIIAIYSCIAIVLLLWCFFGTKERVHTQAAQEAEQMPVLVRLGVLLKNKYFIIILLAAMFLAVYQNINGTCATYYSQYILGNNEYYSILNIAETVPNILAIMVLAPFIQKFGKRNMVLWGAVVTALAQAILLFTGSNLTAAVIVSVIRGIGKAPLFGCVFTMMAEVINYGHWKTGVRVQALVFCAATVGQKVGGGLTSAVIGWLMDASGFTGLVKEIPSAVAMVSNLYIWGTILAWGLIVVLMLMYKLDKEYGTIIDEMEKKGMLAQTK